MKDTSALVPQRATPARASAAPVEVAATFGETLLSVAHIEPSTQNSGRHQGGITAVVAALLLATAALAFSISLDNAAENKRALHVWTQVDQRPFHEFRPQRLSLAYDWLAFGGLVGGLLMSGLAVARLYRRRRLSSFVVGSDADCDLAISGAPQSRFAVVAHVAGKTVIRFASGMSGELRRGEQVHDLDQLAALGALRPSADAVGVRELALPDQGLVRVEFGQVRLTIRKGAPARGGIIAAATRLEARALRFFAVSAAAHLGLLALMTSMPPDPHSLNMDLGAAEGQRTHVKSLAYENDVPEPEISGGGGDSTGGGGIGGDQGAAGAPDVTGKGQRRIVNRADHPQLSRAEHIARAREAGPVGMLRQNRDLFIAMNATADFSSGADRYDMLGHLYGDESGAGFGNHGHGMRGPGRGDGIQYLDGYSTSCGWYGPTGCGKLPPDSSGGPGLAGRNVGPGLQPRRSPKGPIFKPGKPKVNGELDPAIIREHVRRQHARIRHCYDRALLSKPDLDGTVTARFMIGTNGKVISSQSSGIGHKDLETCVAGVIQSISFPRPDGGGLVHVKSYPFHFRTPK
ncbi:MAG: AgmX/PglI C-terminal domain-containing protein [Myxococcota bacterium]